MKASWGVVQCDGSLQNNRGKGKIFQINRQYMSQNVQLFLVGQSLAQLSRPVDGSAWWVELSAWYVWRYQSLHSVQCFQFVSVSRVFYLSSNPNHWSCLWISPVPFLGLDDVSSAGCTTQEWPQLSLVQRKIWDGPTIPSGTQSPLMVAVSLWSGPLKELFPMGSKDISQLQRES